MPSYPPPWTLLPFEYVQSATRNDRYQTLKFHVRLVTAPNRFRFEHDSYIKGRFLVRELRRRMADEKVGDGVERGF